MNSARISFALFGVVIVLITKDIWSYFHNNAQQVATLAITPSSLPVMVKISVPEVIEPFKSPETVFALNHFPHFESVLQFESTIKSCLGRYCMDEVFGDGSEVKRYGLLAPVLTPEIQYIKQLLNRLKAKEYEIELTRHVPPYGYGRNHGWSRIVRFIDAVPRSAFHQLQLATNSSSIANKNAFVAQVTNVYCHSA